MDRLILLISIFSISVALGMKSSGADYFGYIDYFDAVREAEDLSEAMGVIKDPLLYLLVKPLSFFSKSNELVFFSIALISLSAIAISFPSSIENKALFFCIYILIFGAGLYYEAIRAGLGVSFYYLAIKNKYRRLGFVFSILAVASHISLIVPVLASISIVSKTIGKHPVFTSLIFLMASGLIPGLLLLDDRLMWYVNAVDLGTSKVAILMLLLFMVYVWLTSKLFIADKARLTIVSSALVTFCLAAIFSTYSEIAGSRFDELGGALFFLLLINDFSSKSISPVTIYKRIFLFIVVMAFAFTEMYVWYIRFIVNY
jgi:hypothetical protein